MGLFTRRLSIIRNKAGFQELPLGENLSHVGADPFVADLKAGLTPERLIIRRIFIPLVTAGALQWPLGLPGMAAFAVGMPPVLAETLDPARLFHMALKAALRIIHMVKVIETDLVLHGEYFGYSKCRNDKKHLTQNG